MKKMEGWTLHWLEAEGELDAWRRKIRGEISAAFTAISRLVTPPRLDIIIQRLPGQTIPEIGMVGHSYRPSLFGLTLDPLNASFETALMEGALRRQVSYEVHHCMRMARRGYGKTLGEALISEGMAGRFTQLVFGNGPEPWERAVDRSVVRRHLPSQSALNSSEYDHPAWFFGSRDGRIPRWLGYTMGYAIVGEWLSVCPNRDVEMLINTPATDVLAAALPRLAT